VHLINKKLAVFNAAPGILQVQIAAADGFHFRANQFNTGLVFFFDEIFMPGFPVGGNNLDGLLFRSNPLLR
jgi:hypothetical protein